MKLSTSSNMFNEVKYVTTSATLLQSTTTCITTNSLYVESSNISCKLLKFRYIHIHIRIDRVPKETTHLLNLKMFTFF